MKYVTLGVGLAIVSVGIWVLVHDQHPDHLKYGGAILGFGALLVSPATIIEAGQKLLPFAKKG